MIFALGTSVSQLAEAACSSDAKTIETAMDAFHNNPNNTALTDQYPTALSQLTAPASSHYGGPYLRTLPHSSHYTITLDPTPGHIDVNGQDYFDGSSKPCSSVT